MMSRSLGLHRARNYKRPRDTKSTKKQRDRAQVRAFLDRIRVQRDALAYTPNPQRNRHYRGNIEGPSHVSLLALFEGFGAFADHNITISSFVHYLHQMRNLKTRRTTTTRTRDDNGETTWMRTVVMYDVNELIGTSHEID